METTSPDETSPNSPSKEALPERVLPWYRLALLLTGSSSAAIDVVSQTWVAVEGRLAELRSTEGQTALLARKIRETSLAWLEKNQAAPKVDAAEATGSVEDTQSGAECSAPGADGAASAVPVWRIIAALPEPARSAYAFFLSVDAHLSEMGEWLKLKDEAFSSALGRARRLALPHVAESYGLVGDLPGDSQIRFHRPWGRDAYGISRLVKASAKEPKQHAAVTLQAEMDTRFRAEIEAVTLPPGFTLASLEEAAKPGLRSILRQPAVLSIGLALLVVIGVVIYMALREIDDFPGKEAVMELMDETDAMNGTELESIGPIEAGKLEDWFMLKGFDGFSVPPELAKAKIVGARVFKWKGRPVAQLAIDRHNALLVVLPLADLKLTLDSPAWKIFQQNDWAVAARGDGTSCYVISFIGEAEEMTEFLHNVGKE